MVDGLTCAPRRAGTPTIVDNSADIRRTTAVTKTDFIGIHRLAICVSRRGLRFIGTDAFGRRPILSGGASTGPELHVKRNTTAPAC